MKSILFLAQSREWCLRLSENTEDFAAKLLRARAILARLTAIGAGSDDNDNDNNVDTVAVGGSPLLPPTPPSEAPFDADADASIFAPARVFSATAEASEYSELM